MEKYICDLCGYQYDPDVGDKEGRIPHGTPFEELPEKWHCPLCETDKASFVKI